MKKEEKQITKSIRFNYFEIMLKVDEEILHALERRKKDMKKEEATTLKGSKKKSLKLQEKEQKDKDEYNTVVTAYNKLNSYPATLWNISEMLEYIITHEGFGTDIEVDDTLIEIEPKTIIAKDSNIISFQLTKMRDSLLPAKKAIGKKKEDILLTDEEYIGEFTSVLIDTQLSVILIQSNMYGLSSSKIANYLTLLRRKYIKEISSTSIPELECELRVIIDPEEAKKVAGAKYYRKVRVKGADVMMDAFLDSKSIFGQVRRMIGEAKGISFDLSLSITDTKITDTLVDLDVKKLIEEFNSIEKNEKKPLVEITMKNSEESNVELVNLLNPRITDIISFQIKPRSSVGHEFLYDKMKGTYIKKQGLLVKLLRPREGE